MKRAGASEGAGKGARSRQRMVAATAELLQRQGYNGTGLSQILRESGSPKGSMYFHFPGGKEELAIAALREGGNTFNDRLRQVIVPSLPPGEAIELACTTLAEILVESDFHEGCPLATVTLEAAASSEPIRQVCQEQFESWQQLIVDIVRAQDVPDDEAQDLAVTTIASIEGALILCRAYRSTKPLELVGRQLKGIVRLILANTR